MSGKSLVIVESPTKAKTIRKFLPKSFQVEASMGHVRDLPQSAADIPPALKKEAWAKIGVNVENDFEPLYVVPKGKSKIIKDLKDKIKSVDELYLATDEDREGESISWHLIQVLKPKIPVKRMVFDEITKSAIERAIKNCRDIDKRLVQAQETRRVLDRLVGYTLSPLIWKKIAYGLSAGRVQSAGLRILVERERERFHFKKAVYWDLKAQLEKDKEPFEAKLLSLGNKRIAVSKDFDETTGKLLPDKDVIVLEEPKAQELSKTLKSATWKVNSVEEKTIHLKPSPPFITSTLQQDSNRKLGLSAKDTMRTAQALYEQGLITYMRTDSPGLSKEGIEGARAAAGNLFGSEYVANEARQFTSKSKSAQEAHEAIRPAGEVFVHPSETGLSGKEKALYELIWKRTLATQMAEAKRLSISVRIQAGDAVFSASGMKILFAGFLKVYGFEEDTTGDGASEDKEMTLPRLATNDLLSLMGIEPQSHETKPPARFTEASLVQRLDKEGIGRPSTYASIIGTVQDRGYVKKMGNALVPTFTGIAVTQLLENHFGELVDYKFTSSMEQSLDEIAQGEKEWLPYLKQFYLGKNGLLSQVESKEAKIDPETCRTVNLLASDEITIRVGRYGPYVVKNGTGNDAEALKASLPDDVAPADLTIELIEELLLHSEKGPKVAGIDPKTGLSIYVMLGRFGPYVQLGDLEEGKPKPKRASIPKAINYNEITLEQALKLLSLPKELGKHPVSGEPVVANVGRFGPYVVHQSDFRSLKKDDNVYAVTLERALELLAEEKKGRGGSKLVREVGAHPETQKRIYIYEGKYGLFMKYKTKNVGLPKDMKPEEVTVEKAIELIEGSKKGKKAKKAARKAE